MGIKFSFILGIVLLFCSCQNKATQFVLVPSSKTGINFSNSLKSSASLNILSYLYHYNGAGVAAGDYNNDGLTDLYFTSNQGADKLYLNTGNFEFIDITKPAKINNENGWTTGVTHADVNTDGLLDIYVCKVSGIAGLKGKNLLYINQGNDSEGNPLFKEMAANFGLDFSGYSTQAAFFDYDLDGDLDMYLLNHSVHPNRTYGKGSLRESYHPQSGDILFENQNGKFIDISYDAGIFQGPTGYGLGLGISDLNNDGFPDIYVGNDFFENDYCYINNQDGTFSEIISSAENPFGHTTHFSMGNAIGDLNNDGFTDILSTDMLPEDLKTYKTSGLEYPYPIYQQYLRNGYQPQYMQNTLHLNVRGNDFLEIAEVSGIAASEWSWAPVVADFDNDGHKDIFITNGIKGATNDMDYMNFIANEDIQKRIDKGLAQKDMPLIDEIPEKKMSNYIFKSNGDLTFSNVSESWLPTEKSFSNGAVACDLDNDGDLDIVVNNVNEPAYVLENLTESKNYLKIKLKGLGKNRFGLGARIEAYVGGKTLATENFNTRAYLSARSNTLHLGLGNDSILDSIKVFWPCGNTEKLTKIRSSQTLSFRESNAKRPKTSDSTGIHATWVINDSILEIRHQESLSLDFDREPLIPYAHSNQGPDLAIADVNFDGLQDFFVCGGKNQASILMLQKEDGAFEITQEDLFMADKINEDVACLFFDANGDQKPDLLVGSGGNEFSQGKPLQPRLYINQNGRLQKQTDAFDTIFSNVSKIAAIDLENDGDQDLIILSDRVPGSFGETPKQYVFENLGEARFVDVTEKLNTEFNFIGNATDVVIFDENLDGLDDILVVGHWMKPTLFLNYGTHFEKKEVVAFENCEGLWNNIETADIDNDGDLDFVAGNWGLNTKLKATPEKPLYLYRNDFDDNGKKETVVTYFHGEIETPFSSKDNLVKQLPFLNKNFLSYQDFASASLEDLFGKRKLNSSYKKRVNELASCIFINKGKDGYEKKALPLIAQISSVFAIQIDDFNKDGFQDLLIGGNNFEINTQLGRLDALRGLILFNNKNGGFSGNKPNHLGIKKAIRSIDTLTIGNLKTYLLGINNGQLTLLQKNQNK